LTVFEKLFDFEYKRTSSQAIGFLVAYFFVSILILLICAIIEWYLFHGHAIYFLMPGASWVRLFVIFGLSAMILIRRKLYLDWPCLIIATSSILLSINSVLFPYIGVAYLSAQAKERNKTREWIAIIGIVLTTATFYFNYQKPILIGAKDFLEIRTKGTPRLVKVLSFNEFWKSGYDRKVRIKIEWPTPDGKTKDYDLFETWNIPAPKYKPGDMIQVCYYPKPGKPDRFRIVTVNKLSEHY
jgi:hypothetical protein